MESEADTAVDPAAGADDQTTENYRTADPATEVIAPARGASDSRRCHTFNQASVGSPRRRIRREDDRDHQRGHRPGHRGHRARPPSQAPARATARNRCATSDSASADGAKLRPSRQRSWGWVLALILVIAALAAVAILGTLLLTRNAERRRRHRKTRCAPRSRASTPRSRTATWPRCAASPAAALRDSYVNYDEREWTDTYRRVAAAKQYPVVASIDQVVVNGDHAEANVTTFMAYAPQTRSTRSFDLQFRDDQWKICQSSSG